MPLYVVTMSHPKADASQRHVLAHVDWMRGRIDAGRIRFAGRVRGLPLRSGVPVCQAENRDALDDPIATDPVRARG